MRNILLLEMLVQHVGKRLHLEHTGRRLLFFLIAIEAVDSSRCWLIPGTGFAAPSCSDERHQDVHGTAPQRQQT